ncbi:DUF4437 domain-containing protein [Profundibacter sp.]
MPLRSTLLSLCAIAGFAYSATAAEPPAITLIPTPTLDWNETPEGVAFAALEGDRFTGPYHAMVRLPAGITSPLHIKSANMFGVMIQGEMTHIVAGQNPDTAIRIGAGSFYKVPKGLPHISTCISEVPCIAYLYQDGAFDFMPVTQ